MKKIFMPISIDISGKKILVIGGGNSALKKIKILQRFDANIEVLAKDIIEEILESDIRCILKEYDKTDLQGYALVYSCTNNEKIDLQIVEDALEMGVLINIHDNPALCQFVSPAIYKYGNISVAVSSNAEDVYESIRIRNLIKEFLENNKNLQ